MTVSRETVRVDIADVQEVLSCLAVSSERSTWASPRDIVVRNGTVEARLRAAVDEAKAARPAPEFALFAQQLAEEVAWRQRIHSDRSTQGQLSSDVRALVALRDHVLAVQKSLGF